MMRRHPRHPQMVVRGGQIIAGVDPAKRMARGLGGGRPLRLNHCHARARLGQAIGQARANQSGPDDHNLLHRPSLA